MMAGSSNKPNPFGAPMTALPINNVFASPSTPNSNPFGAPAAGQPAPPISNVFAAPQALNSFAGGLKPAPFSSRPSSVGSDRPFGAPSTQASPFGTPVISAPASRVPSPANALGNVTASSNKANPFGPPGAVPNPWDPASTSKAPAWTKNTSQPSSNPFAKPSSDSTAPSFGTSAKGGSQGTSTFGMQQPANGKLEEPRGPGNPFAYPKGQQKKSPPRTNEPANKFGANGRAHAGVSKGGKLSQAGQRNKKSGPTREPTERTQELSKFAFNYANKLSAQLRKDNIYPPNWPPDPGNPAKRAAIDALKQKWKQYRTKVYSSLRKADLIDDPDKRRRLEDALPFKGVCEDMCPEFEQVCRIAEFDVKMAEKEKQADGTLWPEPSMMVKKFGRSAAGQDAPLPMDVRSVDALRRTTDYLLKDLLQSDDNSDAKLPVLHNFLWDRTRAVRKDFTFHSQKSREEMKDLVYVFEAIARFHAVSFHLLSRKGFAHEDFEQKQETEQLGRTMLSLIEAYRECRRRRIPCENEAEFRAYYLLLNVQDSTLRARIGPGGPGYWSHFKEIQVAQALILALENGRESKGPIKPLWLPAQPSHFGYMTYFEIVESPVTSYYMACFAAIHFGYVRENILRQLVSAYSRPRGAPRTITADKLKEMLRFDTPEEAVEFVEAHGFEMITWAPSNRPKPKEPYIRLDDRTKFVPSCRVKNTYATDMIERKRGNRSLPDLIFNTGDEGVKPFPSAAQEVESSSGDSSPEGLFVRQPSASKQVPLEVSPTKTNGSSTSTSSTPSVTAFPKQGTTFGGITAASAPILTAQPTFGGSITNSSTSTISNFQAPATSQTAGSTGFSSLNQNPSSTPVSAPAFGLPTQSSNPSSTPPGSPQSTLNSSTNPLGFAIKGKGETAQGPITTIRPLTSFAASNNGAAKASQSSSAPLTARKETTVAPQPPASGFVSMASVTPLSNQSNLPTAPSMFSKRKINPFLDSEEDTTTQPAPAPAIQVTPPSASESPNVAQQQQQPPSGMPPVSTQPKSAFGLGQLGLSKTSSAAPPSQGSPFQQPAALVQPTPSIPPPAAKRDLMGDFTKWYVAGDGGLVEDFTENVVATLLSEVYLKFEQDKAEKARKEEDDRSWAEARKHMAYRLSVKYFYKWQENVRKLATKRILREGKEKMRAYMEFKKTEAKKKREEDAKAAAAERKATRRRIEADGQRLSALAMAEQQSNIEKELLASGIFSGLRNATGAARNVVRETANGETWRPSSSTFSPDYAESELVLEPPRRSLVASRSSAQSPDIIDKIDGWKTRSLREKFGMEPRRSVSASSSLNGSFISRFRQSLPGSNFRASNFSKKRSASESSDGEPEPKRKTTSKTHGFKSRHWELRARGFVPLANGDWVTEAVAESMKREKSVPKTREQHHGALGPEHADDPGAQDFIRDDESIASTTNNDYKASFARWRERLAQLKKPGASHSHHHSISGYELGMSPRSVMSASPTPSITTAAAAANKRKRDAKDDDAAADGESPSPKSAKRSSYARTGSIANSETAAQVADVWRTLRELREDMDRADRDRPLVQQQMEAAMLGNPS